MKVLISLLFIIVLNEAAPPAPPSSQYEGQAVGAMPCYLGCCKLIHNFSLIYFFTILCPPFLFFYEHEFDFIMYIHVFTLGTPCERINCMNGGYCIQPSTPTSLAYCHCPAQYSGYRCEQPGTIEEKENSCNLSVICHYMRKSIFLRPWKINLSYDSENCVFHLLFINFLSFFLFYSFNRSLFKFSMQPWNLSKRS